MAPGMNVDVKDLPPELREEGLVPSAETWVTALEREAESLLKRGDSAISTNFPVGSSGRS